jgi:FAD synthetase
MKKVLCGGCFNKIHKGHVYFLKQAKSFGDYLIVVLANANNNNKPYAISVSKRRTNVKKLNIANDVVTGHPTNVLSTIKKYKPNIIVLGYDQQLSPDVKKYVKSEKIKVRRIKKFGNYSSKNISEI